MKYYNLSIEETLKELKSRKSGLNEEEVNERLNKYGKNILKEEKKDSKIKRFINQFNDLMIFILFIAAIVSFIISYLNHESYIDSIIIIVIVIINALLGFIQELKADNSLEALKKMQTTKSKVIRNGKIIIIDSSLIVKGDILVLEAGDIIPADARIISEVSLKCDESSLTGESLAVEKNIDKIEKEVPLSSRLNMIYSGTNVVYGKCKAVVTNTGMNSEFGLIASSLNNQKKEITPLERKINGISKFLSLVILFVIIIIFIIGIIKKMAIKEVLMISISLAVAAIPEGLPAVITIALSLGVASMAKKKAIVRKISSVETLGCTEVICSDKTGTITQNKMTVRKIYFDNKILNYDDSIDNSLLEILALNNDVYKNESQYIGDPTEIALYELCENHKINIDDLKNKNIRIDELPFDSERKMMSTIHNCNGSIKMLTKGSFDSIINCCSKIYENGKIQKLDSKRKEELKDIERKLSNKAYRILALSTKELKNNYVLNNDLENNLVFVGMVCMIDPPRIDVKDSIKACKKANIKPVMITGDSLDTACAIASEIGILDNKNQAITGSQLDKISKEELKEKVKNYSVYARVSPMNKLSIVNAWKENNVVVAMTGDGVNDAPALNAANIGIGMGITGTEVSKNVSDIILSDDSFSTIVTAVGEGRRIFDNIRNVLVYLLTGNIAEILIVFIGMLFGVEILSPIQLLYINLITDSIPAIALSFEEAPSDVMNRKVRKKDGSFFTPFLLSKIIFSAILKSFIILLMYFINIKLYGIEISSTIVFFILILVEIIYAYSCRNLKKSIIFNGLFKNSYMNKGVIILCIMHLLVFFTPIRNIFNIVNLNLQQVLFCILAVISVFLIDELSKNVINKLFKD